MLLGATVPPAAPPVDPVRAAEYWLDGNGITDAWKSTRGAGVRIAIIDTGIGRGPVEFDGAVVGGTDVSGVGSQDGRTPVGAVDGNHGSWVGSLAASRGTGATTGMIGVAPEAQLLSVSVGFGSSATVPFAEQIAEAIRWSVDNGADVINLSLTTNTPDWDASWDSAFLYAFDHDVVVVVAAGNRGSGTSRVGAPATIPGVLTVAGVDPNGKASVEASTQGITIGVSAPSEKLLGVSADGRIVQWDGTSGAAPIVAGIAALVRSAHPDLDAANVINRIIKTARPAAGASAVPDPLYGYGLVDAAAAVDAQVGTVTANPMGSLKDWIRIYRRADSAPVPIPTAEPVVIDPLPSYDTAERPTSPLLPSRETLLYGTLPLMAGSAAAILVALGVTAAVRRFRLASRTPSR
ncbi:MAG: S8 family serine peptidase [Microbacterium sp.]